MIKSVRHALLLPKAEVVVCIAVSLTASMLMSFHFFNSIAIVEARPLIGFLLCKCVYIDPCCMSEMVVNVAFSLGDCDCDVEV